ncbi:Crp/Fnr family transcriptional regulator [Sulfuricaulis limicola]|uniref:Crp/Fnr family transcriptional regulator n=1 Tax=Sulfuricaulis limicola TaxID=1620215 RepID=A0A1B4XH60_9GAMM|nr:Crp/Fnr family transcriptional regulator [Sulfuricaulis limicola]BAV34133.1 Crp/Fnr family transcriptional regulator [Sulfuricaulis limicola]
MECAPSPIRNHLLAALPAAEYARILPHLELLAMPLGKVLYEARGGISHAYFPTTAVVSLDYVMQNGAESEITEVGNEGVVGISLFMDGQAPPGMAIVHIGGYGYRLKARMLMEEFNRDGAMQHLLLLYTQARITQVSQTAVCNRHHTVEQQLCRWLLQTLDRLPSGELTMTHELIAGMLGVRREGITEAAGHLQHAGCIRYRRGHITVLGRSGIESRACECYAVVKNEFTRLLARAQSHQTLPSAGHDQPSPRFHLAKT